jgi:hypothetical protein
VVTRITLERVAHSKNHFLVKRLADNLKTYWKPETVFTCLPAACRVSWIPSAAAVRAGDDFKQMTVRVFEVDTASVVVVIDLT